MAIFMNKAILLGNGSKVLEHKVGYLIDQFDCVVRFNNFVIEGFEEFVGTKTDVIARRSCDDIKMYKLEPNQHILNFVSYGRHAVGMGVVARNLKGHYKDQITNLDVQWCKKVGDMIGLQQPVPECCTIGVLAIAYFLEQGKEITLHGFGGSSNGKPAHYFPKRPNDSQYHNFEKERAWIERLFSEGRLSYLLP